MAGTPFWVVDMGACEVRRDFCHDDMIFSSELVSMLEVKAIIDEAKAREQWVNITDDPELRSIWGLDTVQCRKILEKVIGLRIDGSGGLNTSDMDNFPYMPHHQHRFNRVYEINVDIFVDALDGQTVWFRENEEFDTDSRWRISHFEDKNVWFLEDGGVTFASNWPKGYVDETMWLLDEWER